MKKKLLFYLSLLAGEALHAQQYPDLSGYIIDTPATQSAFAYACGPLSVGKCKSNRNHIRTEIPPWIIISKGALRSYFLVDGVNSYMVSISKSITKDNVLNIKADGTGPVKICGPLEVEKGDHGDDWRRNYFGMYTAQYLDHPVQGPVALGFMDAENKAMCSRRDSKLHRPPSYPSTVVPYKPSYSTDDNPYSCPLRSDFYPTFGGFICAGWMEYSASVSPVSFHDLGPIAWPSNGYLSANGQKVSTGANIPSSIVYDGYVYVFYHDQGPYQAPGDPPVPDTEGRHEGIKVVRAPVADALNPAAYKAFYQDPNGIVHWNPALPVGFDRNFIDTFWNKKGPLATDVMGDEGSNQCEDIRFSVAQVANANPVYFIGVESYKTFYQDATGHWHGRPQIALRFSPDLLHWSERKLIVESTLSWDQQKLNYPVLCNAAGTSNTYIDINDFYILGKGPAIDNTVNKVHIYKPVQ